MSEKVPVARPLKGRPILSDQGRLAADARSERQAAALRENLLKRKRQQRARAAGSTPFARTPGPTES
jgi:hypothetical protein